MAPIFLALIFRNADGSFAISFWICTAQVLLMVTLGIWCLVAPESFVRRTIRLSGDPPARRFWAFGIWSWPLPKSHLWVRVVGASAIAIAIGLMTLVVFFTVPGRYY